MYINTIPQPKCSSFSFSLTLKKALRACLIYMDSLEKAHRVNDVALRSCYDAEAVKRAMFEE